MKDLNKKAPLNLAAMSLEQLQQVAARMDALHEAGLLLSQAGLEVSFDLRPGSPVALRLCQDVLGCEPDQAHEVSVRESLMRHPEALRTLKVDAFDPVRLSEYVKPQISPSAVGDAKELEIAPPVQLDPPADAEGDAPGDTGTPGEAGAAGLGTVAPAEATPAPAQETVSGPFSEVENATILQMNDAGAGTGEIAAQLNRHVGTLNMHLSRLLKKRREATEDLTHPAWHREIDNRLAHLGYPSPWTTALDLELVERHLGGEKIPQIALDLGLDTSAVKARYLSIARPIFDDHGELEGRTRLLAVMRARAGH